MKSRIVLTKREINIEYKFEKIEINKYLNNNVQNFKTKINPIKMI